MEISVRAGPNPMAYPNDVNTPTAAAVGPAAPAMLIRTRGQTHHHGYQCHCPIAMPGLWHSERQSPRRPCLKRLSALVSEIRFATKKAPIATKIPVPGDPATRHSATGTANAEQTAVR